MLLLRCAKCGSDAGFLVETQDRKILEVRSHLPVDRIKKAVLVTCTYCNNRWDHAPITVSDPAIDISVRARVEQKILH
ncbi:MAG: hypothetical protein ACYDBQ_04390 [Thermoplasmatota archaeon]